MRYFASLATLFLVNSSLANTNVSYITLEEDDGYTSKRVYAGQVVAARAAELGFKINGRVANVMTDLGQTVKQGQPLAQLDTAELSAQVRNAEANVALAEANATASRAEFMLASNTEKRFRQLREQGHTPKQTYDEALLSLRVKQSQLKVTQAQLQGARANLDATRVTLEEATIRAPFAGTIQSRFVDEGSQINPAQPILRIVELDNLEAHIGVPGAVGASLQQNQVYQASWNGETMPARLVSVLPEIDPATRTQTAVLTISNTAKLPLGSTIELTIDQLVESPGYWLPLTALTQSDRGLWGVYVIEQDDIVSRRLVEIVHTETDRVFARGTLAAGDRVVDTGVHRIVPQQHVSPTQSRVTSNAR